MKFLFTAFGMHNPYLHAPLPDHAVFPLSKEGDGGLDLDYTALMLGPQFVMDAAAFDFVVDGPNSHFLRPMAKTLRRLKEEGLLAFCDYGNIVRENSTLLEQKLNVAIQDPIPWFRIVQGQWRTLQPEFYHFHKTYGRPENEQANTVHSGVLSYVTSQGPVGGELLLADLTKLLNGKKARYSASELSHIRGVIKPLVAQIMINDLVRSKLESPFLDWDDAKGYYEKLYSLRWEDGVEQISVWQQASIMFDAVIPDLKPNNIDAVIRFMRDDKAVESMREELTNLMAAGQVMSAEFFVRYANRVVQRELAIKSKMKKYRLGGAAITSLIPGGGLFQDVAIAAAEDKIEDLISEGQASKMRWFYALQREALKK